MDDSRPGGVPRRFGVALACVPLVALLLTDAAVVAHRAGHQHGRTARAAATVSPTPDPQQVAYNAQQRALAARTRAIKALLARRSQAILHHDKAALLATVDPSSAAFRRSQATFLANLAAVPFASWSYDVGDAPRPSYRTLSRYHAPTFAPLSFRLHYRIRGFDTDPTNLDQAPTFVERHGQWYLASLGDFASAGFVSATDIWDYGPVSAVRRTGVLVLTHPQTRDTAEGIADQAAAAIPRVTAVWGRSWARRLVVVVPRTQSEMAKVISDTGDLDQIAAVASAEVQTGAGKPNPVGDRIVVNPRNWPKLDDLGRRVVLTHETTHVATRSVSGGDEPTWLVEGIADYVGFLGTGVPVSAAAHELQHDVQAGHAPKSLPSDNDYDGANAKLAQAYEEGWLACRLIVARHGQAALVRLYRVIGTSNAPPDEALRTGLRSVLHTTPAAFVAAWRAYVRAQLA